MDASPHRAELPAAYQLYTLTAGDGLYRAETEDLQMLLRPLFATAFLIDDQLADEGLTDRGPILISSASSKTAIAVAYLLAQREEAEVVGLTSSRNVDLVESLDLYDRCVDYDDIGSLEREPASYVDIAGDAGVRLAVHSQFRDELAVSMAVGLTHWEEPAAGQGELPGPPPTLFFAPDRMRKRASDWGTGSLLERIAEAWHPFCDWAGGWLEVTRGRGLRRRRERVPRGARRTGGAKDGSRAVPLELSGCDLSSASRSPCWARSCSRSRWPRSTRASR